jgi:hypothetical protein
LCGLAGDVHKRGVWNGVHHVKRGGKSVALLEPMPG